MPSFPCTLFSVAFIVSLLPAAFAGDFYQVRRYNGAALSFCTGNGLKNDDNGSEFYYICMHTSKNSQDYCSYYRFGLGVWCTTDTSDKTGSNGGSCLVDGANQTSPGATWTEGDTHCGAGLQLPFVANMDIYPVEGVCSLGLSMVWTSDECTPDYCTTPTDVPLYNGDSSYPLYNIADMQVVVNEASRIQDAGSVTGVTCGANMTGAPAITRCGSDQTNFGFSGCYAEECMGPDTWEWENGYDTTNMQINALKPSFDVTGVVCKAPYWHGTPTFTPCAGGQYPTAFGVSGCDEAYCLDLKADANNGSRQLGYDYAYAIQSSLKLDGFEVSNFVCYSVLGDRWYSTTSSGSATVTPCTQHGQPYTLTGCGNRAQDFVTSVTIGTSGAPASVTAEDVAVRLKYWSQGSSENIMIQEAVVAALGTATVPADEQFTVEAFGLHGSIAVGCQADSDAGANMWSCKITLQLITESDQGEHLTQLKRVMETNVTATIFETAFALKISEYAEYSEGNFDLAGFTLEAVASDGFAASGSTHDPTAAEAGNNLDSDDSSNGDSGSGTPPSIVSKGIVSGGRIVVSVVSSTLVAAGWLEM